MCRECLFSASSARVPGQIFVPHFYVAHIFVRKSSNFLNLSVITISFSGMWRFFGYLFISIFLLHICYINFVERLLMDILLTICKYSSIKNDRYLQISWVPTFTTDGETTTFPYAMYVIFIKQIGFVVCKIGIYKLQLQRMAYKFLWNRSLVGNKRTTRGEWKAYQI